MNSKPEVSPSVTGKNILFVTGTRADYGKLEPLAQASRRCGFNVSFFITGMHMMKRYGETRHEVRRFVKADFFEYVNQREGDELDFILSKTILGFSDFVHEHRPDLVVIHGDRVEALGASVVCAMNYIRSAHIEGGEVSGTIDESIRHCNTKLCATHFVSSDDARQRVIALGESPERVFKIGSPELDTHLRPSGVSIEEVKSYYSIPFDDYGIAIFHPVTSEINTIKEQASNLFDALRSTDKCFVVIAPNNDPGTNHIFSIIEKLPNERFRVIPSMRFNYFSELMKNAAVMVGNSSAGVREAPFIGLPSIDIGTRQYNRVQSGTVWNVPASASEEIYSLVLNNWSKPRIRDFSFGTGLASDNFVRVISAPDFWRIHLQKGFDLKVGV